MLHRSQALESVLDAFMVVPTDVFINCVVHLRLEVPEEVFYHRIVVTVSFPRHRLCAADTRDECAPAGMLVLKSLVGMHKQSLIW